MTIENVTPQTPAAGATPVAPVTPATPPVTPAAAPKSILDDSAKPDASSGKSILDESIDEAAQAENKRILEADPNTLTEEEKTTRKTLEDAKKAADAKTIPEKYDVKLPEGMAEDTELLEKVTPVLKEIGITAEAAQKLVDVYAPYIKEKIEKQQKAFDEAQEANFKTFLETERKATMEKLGPNAKQELAFAAKSRDRFLSKETQELLNSAGISNTFNFISDMIRIGRAISEDKLVDGKQRPVGDQRTDGQVLYGSEK